MAVKAKNELKIGILVAVTITLFILGFNFLRGKGFFSSDKGYYSYYDNVQGLQESAAVLLNGFKIGKVSEIILLEDRKIKVIFQLKKDIKVPVGTVAQLTSNDLISGTKIISLNFSDKKEYIKEDGFIEGESATGIFDNLGEQASPIFGVLQHTLISLDTVINTVNALINEDARRNLNASFASLEIVLKQLSELSTQLNAQSGNLSGVIKNANSITGNLANSNAKIANTLDNLENFSTNLNDAPIQETLDGLQVAATGLRDVVAKINDNNGSIGMLLNDKKLYNNLTNTLGTLDSLLGDLKEHPAKYINVSVFGRKAQ